jgi:multimeric flavodoxin WrbA
LKILGIVGSPRLGGNSEALTKIALEEIANAGLETELITLVGKKIAPCDACRSCRTTGECHHKDDFQEIYGKMLSSDGFILASPVWHGAASPQTWSLVSRTIISYYTSGAEPGEDVKPFENKVGGPIVVGRRAGLNFTLAQLTFFFLGAGMVVPGSSYWNVAFGLEKGEALEDGEGVRTMRDFGRKLAWLAKKVNS